MIIIMNLFIMLYNIHSPLEQFEVVSLAYTEIPYFGHVALTNLGLYTIITVFFVLAFHILGFNHKIVPSRWSLSLESSFASVHGLVKSQVGAANERFLPFVYSLFFFLLFANPFALSYLSPAWYATIVPTTYKTKNESIKISRHLFFVFLACAPYIRIYI